MAPQRIVERVQGLLVLLLILFVLFLLKPASPRLAETPMPCESPLFVQIEGEVRYPGVYAFCDSASLGGLIRKAGGLREGRSCSEDRRLAPNAKISVIKEGEAFRIQQGEISSSFKMTLGIPIALNTVSEEGLTALPGVGRSISRAIVEERARRGGFKSLDELMGISGIGPKLYAKMKPYLTL
jgi:competence protein ComEA